MVRMNGRITLAVLLICHTCWLVRISVNVTERFANT